MTISRRKALLAAGAAAAVASIPVGQHVLWNSQSFQRDGVDTPLPDVPEGEVRWTNWSGIQHSTPRGIAVPASDNELADTLRAAEGHVRPVGTGHSFTGLVPSEGTIVDVSRFGGLISHDMARMTATFGAGTRLRQASRELAAVGLGFPNMPDIDVQTLAGSFATATHGAGAELTAIHDYVVGFRLVTAAGDIIDVTAATHPDLFAAGKVSLGALGVITQYTLSVVPAFKLRRTVVAAPIEEIMSTADAEAEANRAFEFFCLPGTGIGATLTHNLYEGSDFGEEGSDDDNTVMQLKEARDMLGWWPWLRRKAITSGLPSGVIEERAGESWRLLSTTRPIKFNEMEYHIPRENGIATLRKIVDMFDRKKDAFFPMEVRYVASDAAWLSPFKDGGAISIAIHAYADEPYDYFFSEMEPVFRAAGGRPHWGKLHSLKKADLVELYPDFEQFLELRKTMDPSGTFLNQHLAGLFGEQI